MITFKKQAAQGDLLITKIDSIPDDAVLDSVKGDYVVAHSETGHNHVMATEHCEFYKAANDPFVLFLVVKNETPIRHLRNFDTHKTINVPPGKYRVNRQREYISEGFRRAAD